MRILIASFTVVKLLAYLAAIAVSIFTEHRFFYVLIAPLVFDMIMNQLQGFLIRNAVKHNKIKLFLSRDKIGFPWPYASLLIVFIVLMMFDYLDLKPVPFLLIFMVKIAEYFFLTLDWSIILQNETLLFRSALGKEIQVSELQKVLIRDKDRAEFKSSSRSITKEFVEKDLQDLLSILDPIKSISIKDMSRK